MTRELQHELSAIRDRMVDRILAGLSLIALIGVPASVSRMGTTGWLPMYGLHIGLGLAVLLLYWQRKRISTRYKSHITIAIFWIIGLLGLKNLGLLGAGTWWLVTSALLISVLYSQRAGLFAIAAVCLVVAGFGAAYTSGLLKLGFDANLYITQAAAWATLLIATVLLPLVVFSAVSNLSHTVVELSHELDRQRAENAQLASTDELTGIPRSAIALDRLQQALVSVPRQGRKVAVLFIDLDGFKQVNDEHGHAAGDSVLCTVAQRCRQKLRVDDTLARQGGDEFIVILQGLAVADQALEVADKLIESIAAPIQHGELSLQVGASIGVAVSPDHAASAEQMIMAADQAMYAAKRAGKNRCVLADRPHGLHLVRSRSA